MVWAFFDLQKLWRIVLVLLYKAAELNLEYLKNQFINSLLVKPFLQLHGKNTDN